ncbi:MAG TPA: hypothetical protein VF634_00255 [Pyrinomonadaceae bacterium]|jgi:hypothetical protein
MSGATGETDETGVDEKLNPLELEQRSVNVAGDEGLVDGEPGAGTDANYSAPPPRVRSRETGDLAGATTTHDGAPGKLEQTGGDGTAPSEVK